MSFRCWIGWKLRRWADRIDHCHAPKSIGWSFTFERGVGIQFWGYDWPNPGDLPRGCPLWYQSDKDYDRSHSESMSQP